MPGHIIIDGNNLLHAMHAHAPIPLVARETMVKVIERWARLGSEEVTLVFDGPVPRGGMSKQMASSRIAVRFSAPKSADDILVDIIDRSRDPGTMRVVSSDTAIRHAARARRCVDTDSVTFVHEIFAKPDDRRKIADKPGEKPGKLSKTETDEWLEIFGMDDKDEDEPFDGFNAIKC